MQQRPRILKLEATPEEVTRRIFENAHAGCLEVDFENGSGMFHADRDVHIRRRNTLTVCLGGRTGDRELVFHPAMPDPRTWETGYRAKLMLAQRSVSL